MIDAHDSVGLPAPFYDEFECRLMHTGETFGKDEGVRCNADYPEFERFVLEDVVAHGDRAVGRARVTGTGPTASPTSSP